MKNFLKRRDLKCRKRYGEKWPVIIVLIAWSCGSAAIAQTTNDNIVLTPLTPIVAEVPTNKIASNEPTNVANLGNVTVVGQLNQARSQILTEVGATAYTHSAQQIVAQSQGENAPLNQVILRSPGVAQDSAENGDLHVRGEHANLQYRINGVLLPEGITGGFGLELDPRFIESMQLITGSLPAEYGFRTAGVIDIQTKTGAFVNGGDVGIYGGSYNTFRPSFEYGDSQGQWDYFVDGSYDENDLGVENPVDTHNAIHDHTEQYKSFLYASRILSDTSRITLMGSASYTTYQVPNSPDLAPGTSPNGVPWYTAMTNNVPDTNSADLNENQVEQNYYAVAAYQQSAGNLNYQLAGYGRVSGVHFLPDPNGDLVFNGEASDVDRNLYSGGLQFDASYELGDKHTIRFGAMLLDEYLTDDNATTVFETDAGGDPIADDRTNIVQNSISRALYAGVYVQDEWKLLPHVTLNYGARFDEYYSSFDKENQLSPRVDLVYQPTDWTTLHVGYSRYFTPPPLESVPSGDVTAFNNTSGAVANPQDDPVKAERANYFDVGISQKITKHLQLGVDSYYKSARNQLDDGLFGQSLILSAFNYANGRVYGVEGTASYTQGGFAAYANLAWSVAQGEDWVSSQFLFDPTSLAYAQNHWIYLDHDQRVSGNFGVSYTFTESAHNRTLVYADAIYGSGLRQDGGSIDPAGDPVPNGASVPQYYSINLGAEQVFKIPHNRTLKARIDVVNVTDNVYELRSGSGIGVNAPQWGERRGIFGSLTLMF